MTEASKKQIIPGINGFPDYYYCIYVSSGNIHGQERQRDMVYSHLDDGYEFYRTLQDAKDRKEELFPAKNDKQAVRFHVIADKHGLTLKEMDFSGDFEILDKRGRTIGRGDRRYVNTFLAAYGFGVASVEI